MGPEALDFDQLFKQLLQTACDCCYVAALAQTPLI